MAASPPPTPRITGASPPRMRTVLARSPVCTAPGPMALTVMPCAGVRDGELPREAHHAVLRRGVRGTAPRAHDAGHRGDVDEAPAPARPAARPRPSPEPPP